MRVIAIAAMFCLFAWSLGQTDTFPKTKTHKQSHDSINRGLVAGFKNPSKSKIGSTSEGHSGMHREHRFYSGHYAKDGHYIPEHWQWVWVNDK